MYHQKGFKNELPLILNVFPNSKIKYKRGLESLLLRIVADLEQFERFEDFEVVYPFVGFEGSYEFNMLYKFYKLDGFNKFESPKFDRF